MLCVVSLLLFGLVAVVVCFVLFPCYCLAWWLWWYALCCFLVIVWLGGCGGMLCVVSLLLFGLVAVVVCFVLLLLFGLVFIWTGVFLLFLFLSRELSEQ